MTDEIPVLAGQADVLEELEDQEYYQAGCGSWECRAPECGRT